MNQMEDEIEEIRNRVGMSRVPGVGALNDFLKDAYEVGEDGKVSDVCCILGYNVPIIYL